MRITRIEESPTVTNFDTDIHRIDEVSVGEAFIEKDVAAIGCECDARVETRSIRERSEELIDVGAAAHTAFQCVAGILVFFEFGAFVRAQARGVETRVLDLGAAEVKQAFQFLIVALGIGNE